MVAFSVSMSRERERENYRVTKVSGGLEAAEREPQLQGAGVRTLSPTEALSCLLAVFIPGLAGLTLTPRAFAEFRSFSSWKKLARRGD